MAKSQVQVLVKVKSQGKFDHFDEDQNILECHPLEW